MAQQLLVYVAIILMGGALSLFLAVYALIRFRNAPGGTYYVLAALMASVLSFGYALELTSDDLEQIKFWIGIEYFSLPFLPVFTLLMCLEYAGVALGPWKKRALFVIPALTFVLQHTNDWHHLYYTSVGLRPGLDFPIVELGRGPWYMVHTLFLYGCFVLSMTVLLLRMRRARRRFRLQMTAMTAGLLVPIVGNLYYLAGTSPYGIDLGPVFISVSFVFHSMAVFRFRMFNVAPIARDIVFESMGDGVLVLNERDVVVDYNRAMLELAPGLTKRSIGDAAAEVLADHPEIAECIGHGRECDLKLEAAGPLYVHVRFSPIQDRYGRRSGSIVTFVHITERVMLEQELKKLANTDGLTELLNKKALIENSERALGRQAEGGPGVSVIMFDVDHFKRVNDTFGHEAGDRVLTEVAAVIRGVLDGRGIAGRYGGDEFVLCLPDTGPRDAYAYAERIRAAVEKLEIFVEERVVRVTSSFGVSNVEPERGSEALSMQTLMRRADHALYEAKQLGRNRVCLYRESERREAE
ncbi:histidine kinase N-terminal 7TM domain-containing diguanylate cyclase [Saccharibacillus alkalitolerans]|uniref:Diguanylate cyclase n=1 Tax=Saccharibacillus alkalitolerans TaxID=2705290 RepID=A0ABX0F7X2_9BACL|nr:histidine kinase N-terminal 7TM domain-containing protein [Saccharibacillus alkalitolerans]NGZ76408.1 diguanylate cyclase [Saccharibacillus alkalitolerans]